MLYRDRIKPMGSTLIDMIGNIYGRLTVKRRAFIDGRHPRWVCRCECGTEIIAFGLNLRRGFTRSCGCLAREETAARNRTHGASPRGHLTAEYRAWRGMKTRCTNKNEPSYRYYGGRGISVSEQWLNDFQAFLADMGPRPSSQHSIERIDNSGNYEPSNCRWASRSEQAANKRNNRLITHDGLTLPISEWARQHGLKAGTLRRRIVNRWPMSKALLPVTSSRPNR